MLKEFIEEVFTRVIGATELSYIKKNNWIEFVTDTNDVGDVLAIIQFKGKDWDRSTIVIFELFYNTTKNRFEYNNREDIIAFNTWEEFKQDIFEIETIKSYVDLIYN